MTDNAKRNGIFGLSADAKAGLLAKFTRPLPNAKTSSRDTKQSSDDGFTDLPGYQDMQVVTRTATALGIENPFFRQHDGLAGARTEIDGKSYLNFSSYNYLGLNGHQRVSDAAKAAIDRYGTSVSASRLVSGERPVHSELEQRLAKLYGTEDCLAFVSGHATNVTVIGQMMGPKDLIIHDSLIHNSAIQGAKLSPARRISFPHNDPDALDRLLGSMRNQYKRVLIVLEGLYSMDGDTPDMQAFVRVAKHYKAWLFVDEAHALGVLGKTGRGVAEHWNIDPADVDIWMGTLSKTLCGCGGYIAGRRELIEYLRYNSPGFVFSVGLAPPLAAAAATALDVMLDEPERVARLVSNGQYLLDRFKAAGLDTGTSIGAAVVPLITGSSIRAARLSDALFRRGINVQPILYPAIPEAGARLRFFISSEHTLADMDTVVGTITEELAGLEEERVPMRVAIRAMVS